MKINLFAFYLAGAASLMAIITNEYQKALFELMIALMNLYMFFDWMEEKKKNGV